MIVARALCQQFWAMVVVILHHSSFYNVVNSAIIKAKIKAISSNVHQQTVYQLQVIKLHHFKLEINIQIDLVLSWEFIKRVASCFGLHILA